jgi:hypothetical protein
MHDGDSAIVLDSVMRNDTALWHGARIERHRAPLMPIPARKGGMKRA